MKVIYSNNNICICGNCGCTLQYEMSDIRTKSECFNKGYTNDQYYDINYIHCPYLTERTYAGDGLQETNLTGLKFTLKGVDYEVLEHTKDKYRVLMLNRKAISK